MSKNRNRKYKKREIVDLNGRSNMEIVGITNEERAGVNQEYKEMFSEIDKKLSKKMIEFDRNLESAITEKLLSVNEASTFFSDGDFRAHPFFEEEKSYNHWQNLEDCYNSFIANEEDKRYINFRDDFDNYYKSFINKIEK